MFITQLAQTSLWSTYLTVNGRFMCLIQRFLFRLVAAGSGEQEAESGAELGLAARCLISIADVLVDMADGKGGLRSGPAANNAWRSAYLLLEKDLRGGVQALAAQRENWLSRCNSGVTTRPPRPLPCPRPYSGAANDRNYKSCDCPHAGRICWCEQRGTMKAPARCCCERP